jgi:hypothetical protein
MIILEKEKICFIHIIKTSGISLSKVFSKYISDSHMRKNFGFKDGLWPETIHINEQHSTLKESLVFMEKKGIDYRLYNFITIVRNPYSWIGSIWYSFELHNTYKTLKDYIIFLYENPINFRQFIPNKNIQYDYIKCDNIVVNYYKFEENPIQNICSDIGVDYNNTHLNKKNYDRLKIFDYDDEMINMVNKLFLEDFKKFDYKMAHDINELKSII